MEPDIKRISRRVALAATLAATAALGADLSGLGLAAASDAGGRSAHFSYCPEVVLYFSRGSGQESGGSSDGLGIPGIELYNRLTSVYGPRVGEMANPYPAVAVTMRLLARKIPDPRAVARYRPSVEAGINSAARNVVDLLRLCPSSSVVLGGYSQGAQVTRAVLRDLPEVYRPRIAAVVLFGDPYFDPADKFVTVMTGRERGRRGIFARSRLFKPSPVESTYKGRVFSWCHPNDIICEGLYGSKGGQHGGYQNDVGAAVDQIRTLLAREQAVQTYEVTGTCIRLHCVLAERSGPGNDNYALLGWASEHGRFAITCQALGERVAGDNGRSSTVWDQLANGAFIPDYYLNTPGIGVYSQGIPHCKDLRVVSK